MIPSPTRRPPRLELRLARLLAGVLVLLVPLAGAAQEPAPVDALSLEEAVRRALSHNPEYLQQLNDVDVARTAVRAAVGGLLPKANASTGVGYTASGERRFGSVEFGEQPDYYSSDYSLGFSYQLSGADLLQPSLERSQLRSTERRVSGAEAQLVAQVTQQYLTALQAREQVAQAERELARTGEHVRLAEARLEVGAGTPLDVRRAEVQRGRAQVGLVQARSDAATAIATLAQLLGTPLDPQLELSSRFQVFQPHWQAEALLELAMRNNPILLAARAGEQAAQTSVRAARSSYLPTLSLNVGWRGSVYQAGDIDPLVSSALGSMQGAYAQCQAQNDIRVRVGLAPLRCNDPTDPAIAELVRDRVRSQNDGFPFGYTPQPLAASLTLSLPVFTGFARRLQVDQARAAADDARHRVRVEELRLRQEVGTALRNVETAHQIVLLQEQVRANASEELRLAQERFRFGAASSVEVTDAQTNLAQAEKDVIAAVYDFHKSLAALEALVGEPLRDR